MLVDIKFEVVKPTDKQVEILYKQLRERKYSISNKILPDFEEHKLFVKNNPYRLWYIVRLDDEVYGNVYFNHDNSISLNGLEQKLHLIRSHESNTYVPYHHHLQMKHSWCLFVQCYQLCLLPQ